MNKYISRLTSSQRGETFNPLTWPFFITTLTYGIGFTLFNGTETIETSLLFTAMTSFWTPLPMIWGIIAILTILVGFTFLLFNIPPAGRISGLVGFMLWVFGSFCWLLTGSYLTLFAIGIPSMYFWIWQYLSLSLFRREDALDIATMKAYDEGEYDDEENPKDAEQDREDNRGVDIQ